MPLEEVGPDRCDSVMKAVGPIGEVPLLTLKVVKWREGEGRGVFIMMGQFEGVMRPEQLMCVWDQSMEKPN